MTRFYETVEICVQLCPPDMKRFYFRQESVEKMFSYTLLSSQFPQVPVDVRLDKFKEKAVPLVSDVARRAIKEAGLDVSDISKLVVVSSTGFLGPGLDCELIKNLGLTRSVDRTLIGFMGCAAAMNGFRNANDYVSVSHLE